MEISKEEAIKVFESELKWAKLNTYPYVSKQKIEADKMAIEALKQKTGYWIEYNTGWVSCSICQTSFPKLDRFPYMNYCSYCGRKMIKREDKE